MKTLIWYDEFWISKVGWQSYWVYVFRGRRWIPSLSKVKFDSKGFRRYPTEVNLGIISRWQRYSKFFNRKWIWRIGRKWNWKKILVGKVLKMTPQVTWVRGYYQNDQIFQFSPQGKIRQCIARLSRRTVHRQIRVALNGRPLNTEIFSKRRKIYSLCSEDLRWYL